MPTTTKATPKKQIAYEEATVHEIGYLTTATQPKQWRATASKGKGSTSQPQTLPKIGHKGKPVYAKVVTCDMTGAIHQKGKEKGKKEQKRNEAKTTEEQETDATDSEETSKTKEDIADSMICEPSGNSPRPSSIERTEQKMNENEEGEKNQTTEKKGQKGQSKDTAQEDYDPIKDIKGNLRKLPLPLQQAIHNTP